jgi:hypothetical protein
LRPFLLQLAESDPVLTRQLLAEAADSLGQKGIARRTLIELQARDLERAVRQRDFAHAADFDLPFLPSAETLEATSPLFIFRAAARDLNAGGHDYRQRRLALNRAERALDSFIKNATSSRSVSELSQRLISTARLWMDVVGDERSALAEDERRNPQVPRAYVAGQPLKVDEQGKSLFKGRKDIAALVAHELDPDRRGVLVVVGQRRMGKSSFRNWLSELLGTGTKVIVADFQTDVPPERGVFQGGLSRGNGSNFMLSQK